MGKAVIILIALFLSLQTTAQKWYAITNNDAAIIALGVVSGAADGVNQNLAHWRWGKGKAFWDVKLSWKNKYKDWDGGNTDAAFFGSKSVFVAFTDGYHLTRMIDRSAMLLSIGISAGELKQYAKKDRWKVVAKKILLSSISNRIAFNIIYK
jgi:hemolysin activation/secretion protein